MEFNKEKHIANMQKPVSKLVEQLKKQGISFTPTDGEMNNVIFEQDGKRIKISHHSFYRYSGIAVQVRFKDKDPEPEIVPVTDDLYLQGYIKPVIETLLKV